MAETNVVTELRPSPAMGEVARKPKDRTAAERQRRRRQRKRTVTTMVTPAPTVTVAPVTAPETPRHGGRGVTVCTTVAALALATVSAGFSINGLTNIFVGAFWPVIGMGVALTWQAERSRVARPGRVLRRTKESPGPAAQGRDSDADRGPDWTQRRRGLWVLGTGSY